MIPLITNKQRPKTIPVTIPEEVVFMALSHELYKKHEMNVKEAVNILILEYAYNPEARYYLDGVLKNRQSPETYCKGVLELQPEKLNHIPENIEEMYIPSSNRTSNWRKIRSDPQSTKNQPQIKSKKNKPKTPLEKRINAIWD